ncbi:MAG TPA: serine hydrolase [Lapillicoccus sp.]|uniref:serine hydrolase n=1 Tax=Lapillicoccus sp. TaxID=1909287 RepID=UPI002F91F2BF
MVRRVTGRGLGQFFAEQVAGPLGADFHIGLGAEHDHRVARVIPPATRAPEIEERGPGNPLIPAETANTDAWRRADIPSANGFGNARSVAAVQSVLASGGEVRGVRLLSAAGCERVLEEQFVGADRSWAHRSGTAWATPSGVAPVPGVVGEVRWSWSTSSST